MLDNVALLPNEFVIELRAELTRWCQVVRREANQVAVKFIEPPKNYLGMLGLFHRRYTEQVETADAEDILSEWN